MLRGGGVLRVVESALAAPLSGSRADWGQGWGLVGRVASGRSSALEPQGPPRAVWEVRSMGGAQYARCAVWAVRSMGGRLEPQLGARRRRGIGLPDGCRTAAGRLQQGCSKVGCSGGAPRQDGASDHAERRAEQHIVAHVPSSEALPEVQHAQHGRRE